MPDVDAHNTHITKNGNEKLRTCEIRNNKLLVPK